MPNSTNKPTIVDIDYSKAPVKITETEKILMGKVRTDESLDKNFINVFNSAIEGRKGAATAMLNYIAETEHIDTDTAKAVYIGLAATGNTRAMANLGRMRDLEGKIDEAREMLNYVIEDHANGGTTSDNVAGFAHFSIGEMELTTSKGNHKKITLAHFDKAQKLSDNPSVLRAISEYRSGLQNAAPQITITNHSPTSKTVKHLPNQHKSRRQR
jgi:hypothetical protein